MILCYKMLKKIFQITLIKIFTFKIHNMNWIRSSFCRCGKVGWQINSWFACIYLKFQNLIFCYIYFSFIHIHLKCTLEWQTFYHEKVLLTMAIFFYKSHFKNPLLNPTFYIVEVGFKRLLKSGFSQKLTWKPTSTKVRFS